MRYLLERNLATCIGMMLILVALISCGNKDVDRTQVDQGIKTPTSASFEQEARLRAGSLAFLFLKTGRFTLEPNPWTGLFADHQPRSARENAR